MTAQEAPPSLGFSKQEHWSGLPFPSPMHESEKWKSGRSVTSDSSRPHGLQPTRLLCPWDFPGRSTGVGCHCRLPLETRKGNWRTVFSPFWTLSPWVSVLGQKLIHPPLLPSSSPCFLPSFFCWFNLPSCFLQYYYPLWKAPLNSFPLITPLFDNPDLFWNTEQLLSTYPFGNNLQVEVRDTIMAA